MYIKYFKAVSLVTVVENEQCLNTNKQFCGIFCEKAISTAEKINWVFHNRNILFSCSCFILCINKEKVRSCQFLMLFSRVLNVG